MQEPHGIHGRSPTDVEIFEQTAVDALARLRAEVETQRSGNGPATGYAPIREVLEVLRIEEWIEKGGMDPAAFDSFLAGYLDYSVRFHHPSYIAHQVSVPDFPGALAALINGITNNPMAIYEMGPAAASIEFAVINFMLRKIGWREQPLPGPDDSAHAAGVLTHGGSLANLTALLAARARIAPEAWEQGVPDDLAVLVPPSSHYSVNRAVSILGLGARAIYPLAGDEMGVIDASRLRETLDRVRSDNKRCMALIANAPSTATGLHDPLRPVGEFCREHAIWFHVDACHGATAMLSRRSRHFLDGAELADSLVWDAHKMMQVPVLCAAILLRDARDFDRAFQQKASYLAITEDNERYNSMPRAIECTKAPLGLKIFLNLAWRGERALGNYVDDRYAITRDFYHAIRRRPGFECPYEPQSNILCFRYGDDDDLQDRVRETLLRNRAFHITAATVAGKRYLRLTVMNTLTDETTIGALLDAIEQVAA